ncbi:undecaprenyl-diphosphate phosphatase [Thermovibrio sp.]
MNVLDAVILGIVEGITEFLPISSTGHLILTSHLLGLKQTTFEKTFEIAIQLGAILAVVAIYWNRITHSLELWKRLIAAFIPTAILGLLFHSYIEKLFSPKVVSISLIVGGIVFIIVELLYKEKEHHVEDPEKISYVKAVGIGLFQSLAMIPGTSRSGATIIGGMLLGMKRVAATEFSFLLAIPTMVAATGFETLKNFSSLNGNNLFILATGFSVAFISALIAVKWLLNFIKSHSFIPFGVYRIIAGLLFLLLLT